MLETAALIPSLDHEIVRVAAQSCFGPGGNRANGGELLRAVVLRPRNENLRDGFSKLHSGVVVNRVMNPRPDSGVASLLADPTNEIGVFRKQVGQHLRPGGRESRMVRGVAIRFGEMSPAILLRATRKREKRDKKS